MKKLIQQVNEAAQTNQAEMAIKGIEAVTSVRGARVESFDVDGDTIYLDVEFDFPEHLVKAAEVKAAGAPAIKKVTVQKSDMWRQGMYGVSYTITLSQDLDATGEKSLKSKVKVER